MLMDKLRLSKNFAAYRKVNLIHKSAVESEIILEEKFGSRPPSTILIPIGMATLREFGYCLISNSMGGVGDRQRGYLITRVGDPANKIDGITELEDIPEFIKVKYERISDNRVVFHKYQREKSGKWHEIDKDEAQPRRIRL